MAQVKIIKTTFKLRRGKAEAWYRVNPILADGEPGFELDTNKLKIGNGTTPYADLEYINSGYSLSADNKSLILTDNDVISLYGFNDATVNQIPIKTETGELSWIDYSEGFPISEEELLNILK